MPPLESSEFSVRRYRPGDEHGIQAMYEEVFGRNRSLDEWRWRFQEAPAGAALYLLESDGVIVGHVSSVPLPTWVDGRQLLATQGGDMMVLPRYRGRGGMQRLVEASEADPSDDLRIRFPSEMARHLFVRYGTGRVVGVLPAWVRRHTPTRPLSAFARPVARALLAAGSFIADRPRPQLTVQHLDELGAEVDQLAAKSASFARCIRIRDAEYLRWRWLAQPDAAWEIRAVRDVDGHLTGLSVLGLEEGERAVSGWINDLLATDARSLRALLLDGVSILALRGASSVHCHYLDPRPWSKRVLLRSGFLPSGGHHFVVGSQTPALARTVGQLESWYLTRGDTEPWPNLNKR
jgi:hypothetical protein